MIDFSKRLKPRIDIQPSSADRWMSCTASPRFLFENHDKLAPEDRKYSDEGNSAHEVAAAYLENRKPNKDACPVPVTPEMLWHGWNYAEFVESQIEAGGKVFIEKKLPLFYYPGRNAIIDAAVINPSNLHIIDYKYGEGIIVSPENNLQASIYAGSVLHNWKELSPIAIPRDKNFTIRVTIYQPRTRGDSAFHTWETTLGEIEEAVISISETADKILINASGGETKVDFHASEKACQWCRAKGFCEARHKDLTRELQQLAVIDDSPKPQGGSLTKDQLAAILRHGSEIKKWIDDARDYALQLMRGGGKIPGFKLVTSRGGHRFWTDPKKAAKLLLSETILTEKEVYGEPTITTPAQVEKLLGKKKIPVEVYNLIAKPPGQSVIAPEDDPREDFYQEALAGFKNLDLDENQPKVNLDQF